MISNTADDDENPPERPARAWPWIAALAASGAALAALPHAVRLATTGDPTYIADGDGLLYLAWSRDVVRHGGLAMTDAILRASGPMMHPWLLFVPAAWLAHALGLGMVGLGVVWRLAAGSAIAVALYAAVRPWSRTARGAAGLAAFLLFDAGFLSGQVVQRPAEALASLARGSGHFLGGVPILMPQLRVPTPGLALPFLLAHLALAARARRLGTARSAVASGLALGLLFHVYFYFATAAVLGTALAWLLDRGGRRSYAVSLAVAAVLGAPALIAGARIKASTPPDWLVRTDKFTPIPRLSYLMLPKLLILEWLALAWPVFRWRRDLVHLWALTGAGLALANQHVVTGIYMEDFHWSQAYGTAFSLVLAGLAWPWLSRLRGWAIVSPAVLAAQVVVGAGLRAVEARRTWETNYYLGMLADWRAEGFALPPGSVVAAPIDLLLLLGAMEDVRPLGGRLVEFSSATTDEELDRRDALDLALIGATAEEVRAEIDRNRHIDDDQRRARPGLVAAAAADPIPGVERFGVGWIVAAKGHAPPPALGGRARLEKAGRAWDLWRLE